MKNQRTCKSYSIPLPGSNWCRRSNVIGNGTIFIRHHCQLAGTACSTLNRQNLIIVLLLVACMGLTDSLTFSNYNRIWSSKKFYKKVFSLCCSTICFG